MLTGIPQEQEIPAPVTTTMRLLLTKVLETEARARRTDASDAAFSRFNVVMGIAKHWGGGNTEKARGRRVVELEAPLQHTLTMRDFCSSIKINSIRQDLHDFIQRIFNVS